MNEHILFLGPKWRGSDARALGEAFRDQGCIVSEVDYEDYVPLHWSRFDLRLGRKLLRRSMAADYNQAISQYWHNSGVDFVVVFKGMFVRPETLKPFSCPLYCVYPDVSFTDHGPDIWQCLPHYRCLFTTKPAHLQDQALATHVQALELVQHGADPAVHRPLKILPHVRCAYQADVTFVGCWSPKKERILQALQEGLPDCCLRIWGMGWQRAAPSIQGAWVGRGAYGDELALIYQSSKINLGLLSEAGGGPGATGDATTARTWQIPACRAFLLHERTADFAQHFSEDHEAGCFDSASDIAAAVKRWLDDDHTREAVAKAGFERFAKCRYTYAPAAETILAFHRRSYVSQ